MVDFQSQQMIGVARQPVEPGRSLTAPFKLEETHDVLGCFQGAIGRLIGSGKTVGIALGQDRCAVFLAGFAQIALDLRLPAPDHILQFLVEQVRVRDSAIGPHVERVAQG